MTKNSSTHDCQHERPALIIALLMPDPKSLVYMISSSNDAKDHIL
jgi:hypothetical protein